MRSPAPPYDHASTPVPPAHRWRLLVLAAVAAVLATCLPAGPAAAEDPTAEVTAASLPRRAVAAAGRPFLFPVEGAVRFRDDFGAPRSGGRQHKGNDLMGQKLQKLLATRDGVVTFVRRDSSSNSGNMLALRDAEGWEYWYMHINNDTPGTDDGRNPAKWAFAPGIGVGSRVVSGQHIAYMGDSGNAEGTAPHLHFELHRPGGEVVNPYESLIRAPRGTAAVGRGVALHPDGGYYVLTSDGAVHAFDGAPHFGSVQLYGFARAIAVMPDGRGYTVLDGFGGLHHFGSATALRRLAGPYWSGRDIARDFAITPTGGGFILLDGWGGTHPRGDAPAGPAVWWPNWDIARGVAVTASNAGVYLLDGFGGVNTSGDARKGSSGYWRGRDVARSLAAATSGTGYAVLDGWGTLHGVGTAPDGGRPTPGQGWRSVDVRGDEAVAVRGDGFSQRL
jgi:hypothetical protein